MSPGVSVHREQDVATENAEVKKLNIVTEYH